MNECSIRDFLRRLIIRGFKLFVFPFIIGSTLEKRISDNDSFYAGAGQLLGLFPWKVGSLLRTAFYSSTINFCHYRTYFGYGTYLSHRECEIYEGVFFGSYCVIGRTRIGKNAHIATRVSILSGRHHHRFNPDGSIDQNVYLNTVSIGENAWIGEGSVVMADVGKRSIVGAGSVVVKTVEDNTVVAGNPARILMKHKNEQQPNQDKH